MINLSLCHFCFAGESPQSNMTAPVDQSGLPPAVKIDVTDVAKPYREDVRNAIANKYAGVGPKLVAFLANAVSSRRTSSLVGCVIRRVQTRKAS